MLENLKIMVLKTNLENPNLGRMAQWVKVLQINWKVLGSNPLGVLSVLGTQSCYKAPSDLQVKN